MDSANRKRPAGGAKYGKKRNAGASGKRQDQKRARANSSGTHGNKRFERPKKRSEEWSSDSDFEKPGSDKPRYGKPRSDKPGSDKPRYGKPRSDKPGSDKPGYGKPRSDKPGSDKPGYGKPRSDKPGSDKPGSDKPGSDKPGYGKPRSDKPGSDKPGYGKPGSDKPGYGKPRSDKPGYDKPRYERAESSNKTGSDRPYRERPFRERDSEPGQAREFRPGREPRQERTQDKKAPNVHLSISPRLMELAEIMAEESEMTLQEYLEKCMVLVLKTHAQKLGLNKKSFVTEYTKEHSKKPEVRVSTRKKD